MLSIREVNPSVIVGHLQGTNHADMSCIFVAGLYEFWTPSRSCDVSLIYPKVICYTMYPIHQNSQKTLHISRVTAIYGVPFSLTNVKPSYYYIVSC